MGAEEEEEEEEVEGEEESSGAVNGSATSFFRDLVQSIARKKKKAFRKYSFF